MNIFVFAFKNNISERVLNKLNVSKKFFLESDKKEIDLFVRDLTLLNPEYILGLGMYNRIDKERLRIETHYKKDGIKKPIHHFLKPQKNTKFATGIGNSHCNYISQRIMESYPKIKYTFIHIPKTFNEKLAAEEIEDMIKNRFPPARE